MMNSLHEFQEYFKTQAAAYEAADNDDSFIYDNITLDTFREVLRFAISEGFEANPKAIDRVLNGEADDSEDEEDDYTDWHFMEIITDTLDEQIRNKTLPEKTEAIYNSFCIIMCKVDDDFWD